MRFILSELSVIKDSNFFSKRSETLNTKINRMNVCKAFICFVFLFSFIGTNRLFAQACSNINPAQFGNAQWLGHVYSHDGVGNPVGNPFNDYLGSFNEPNINFDRNWGSGSPNCSGNERFAVRYKMRISANCGIYRFTIGGDDGVRLSIDGGATWLVGIWNNHSYTTVISPLVHLNGTVDFVLEYYENTGAARVSFSYEGLTGTIASGTTQLSSNSGAVGSPVNGSVSGGAVGAGFTYQWQYSDNNGSTWTNIAGQTSSNLTTTAQNSIGTRQYRRETSCSNAISYSSGATYTTVSPCALSVNMTCGTTYSETLGLSGVWGSYSGCNWSEPGGEKVYTFTPVNSGSYTFTANEISGDADFFLMSSCGPSGTNLINSCWDSGNETVNLIGGNTYYLIVDNFSSSNTASYSVSVSCNVAGVWQTQWVSMNTGSSDWCPGETRTVSVTVKNQGSASWSNSSPDINIGVWWGNQTNASAIKVNANGLATGNSQTYTFNVTAPMTLGTSKLIFDVVSEGNFWFADNNNGAGPGNVIYQSAPINIVQYGNPSEFGDNVWNVYAYNGNSTNLSNNTYKGFYVQPSLSAGNFGVNTQSFWNANSSPSSAGTSLNNGDLWQGCGSVNSDLHTFTSKRAGFPCGTYTFKFNNWDDETRLYIDGVSIWSCGVWSGGPGSFNNANGSQISCDSTLIFNVELDENSKVEFQTFENYGQSNLDVSIQKAIPSTISNNKSRTCVTKGNLWIDFQDEDGNLIASINPNGEDLGNVTVKSYFNSSPQVMRDCDIPGNTLYHTAYMGRSWIMESDAFPNGVDFNSAIEIRLPYATIDLDNLNTTAQTVTTGNPFDGGNVDPANRTNLMLTKITGNTENGIANQADCSSNIRAVFNNGSGVNPNGISSSQYVDFSINQFSEFFLHKNNNGSALPVKLTSFSAACDELNAINWTTASEQNSDYFVLEKSRDGQNWNVVAEKNAAGNSNTTLHYNQIDHNPQSGISYYRLRQVDIDGGEEVFGPISVSCENEQNLMKVFPNPNKGSFDIEVSTSKSHSEVNLLISDMAGKTILSKEVNISEGTTQISMHDLNLNNGTYLVRLLGDNLVLRPIKVIVNR